MVKAQTHVARRGAAFTGWQVKASPQELNGRQSRRSVRPSWARATSETTPPWRRSCGTCGHATHRPSSMPSAQARRQSPRTTASTRSRCSASTAAPRTFRVRLASVLRLSSRLLDAFRIPAWVRRHDVVIVPGAGVLEASLPLRPLEHPIWTLPAQHVGQAFRDQGGVRERRGRSLPEPSDAMALGSGGPPGLLPVVSRRRFQGGDAPARSRSPRPDLSRPRILPPAPRRPLRWLRRLVDDRRGDHGLSRGPMTSVIGLRRSMPGMSVASRSSCVGSSATGARCGCSSAIRTDPTRPPRVRFSATSRRLGRISTTPGSLVEKVIHLQRDHGSHGTSRGHHCYSLPQPHRSDDAGQADDRDRIRPQTQRPDVRHGSHRILSLIASLDVAPVTEQLPAMERRSAELQKSLAVRAASRAALLDEQFDQLDGVVFGQDERCTRHWHRTGPVLDQPRNRHERTEHSEFLGRPGTRSREHRDERGVLSSLLGTHGQPGARPG